MWSMGCVMTELLAGKVFFPGQTGIDQLVEIIKVLGTPNKLQIEKSESPRMHATSHSRSPHSVISVPASIVNPNYSEHKFPQIKPVPFANVRCTPTRYGPPYESRADVVANRSFPELPQKRSTWSESC